MTTVARPQRYTEAPPAHAPPRTDIEARLRELQDVIRGFAHKWAWMYGLDPDDLAQEITIRLWKVLQRKPGASGGYLATAARTAMVDFGITGKSVDRRDQRRRPYPMRILPLEGWDDHPDIDVAGGGTRAYPPQEAEWLSPTEDLASTLVMLQLLRPLLEDREWTYVTLRLQGYRSYEVMREMRWSRPEYDRVTDKLRRTVRRWLRAEVVSKKYAVLDASTSEALGLEVGK